MPYSVDGSDYINMYYMVKRVEMDAAHCMIQSHLETRYSSRAKETVVFPAPLGPVNQIVQPRNRLPMTSPRFDLETACFCAYTLVAIVVL